MLPETFTVTTDDGRKIETSDMRIARMTFAFNQKRSHVVLRVKLYKDDQHVGNLITVVFPDEHEDLLTEDFLEVTSDTVMHALQREIAAENQANEHAERRSR